MSNPVHLLNSHGNQSGYNSLAAVYKACGDAMRIEILRILGSDIYGVLELSFIFGLKQSAMSHHLKVLAKAGLVETQREGNSIFYRRPLGAADWLPDKFSQHLFQQLDALPISPAVQSSIEEIGRQRAEQSRAFFAKNASTFKKQQELIAEYPLYAEPMAELIQRGNTENLQTALEIGPGKGEFLEILAASFPRLTALDNAQAMLALAEETVAQTGLNGIEFIHGTADELVTAGRKFDVIVMNMVLHHVPSPGALILDCGQLLNPGGSLFISELRKHDQSWAREACGDIWLGFEVDEIQQWASKANLHARETVYIGVRNGFQLQLHRFELTTADPPDLAVTRGTKADNR